MQNSTLIEALRSLSSTEWRSLTDFTSSPFFQKNSQITPLLGYLRKHLTMPRPPLDYLNKETVWKSIAPEKAFDEKLLRYQMSWLLDAVRQYFIQYEFAQDTLQQQWYLTHALRKRGLDDMFEKAMQQSDQQLGLSQVRDARFHFFRYRFHHESLEKTAIQKRGGNISIQPMTDELTLYFISETLRHACTAASLMATSGHTTQLHALEEALRTVEFRQLTRYPAVSVYYYAYLALTEQQPINAPRLNAFHSLKAEIEQNGHCFPAAERRGIYLLAINYCIRMLNKGVKEYVREAYVLYNQALNKGVLMENGVLSAFTYKNITRLGLALGESEAILEFLKSFKVRLPAKEREHTFCYNLAFYYFQQKNYAEALPLLQKTEFSDVLNNLDARRMLLRAYVELDEYQALQSHLDAFETYLRRQKNIGYGRENYLQLIQFVRKWQSLPGADNPARARLRLQIESATALAERDWLLEKI